MAHRCATVVQKQPHIAATCRAFRAAINGRSVSTAFDVINPANGEAVGEILNDSKDTVKDKFELASSGQRKWRSVPLDQRKAVMLEFSRLLMKETQNLATLMTSEMGKPITQAKNEIRATGLRVKYFVDNADKVLASQTVLETPQIVERVVYEPLGVIANISAWNYPYFVSANVFGAALITGNAVLFKPSEYTSLSGLAMAELLHKAGVPPDVFVTSTGQASTGEAIACLPQLGALCFTGSHRTGRLVAQAAAPNFVKVQLELGGKDPVYVRRDVQNVQAVAAALADGAFYNAGQSCCAVERIYVDKEILSPFLEHFTNAVRSFKVGDPARDDTFIGPLARKAQLSFLQNQVEDALSKGAQLAVTGGLQTSDNIPAGNFFHPTVLTNVNHSMSVMRDESFGPIIGIQAVEGDEEAVGLMEDTIYGLTAGIYCQKRENAEALLSQLDVGTGYWNCCDRSVPRLPWSGRKASGLGSSLGLEGLRACVRPKALHMQKPYLSSSF